MEISGLIFAEYKSIKLLLIIIISLCCVFFNKHRSPNWHNNVKIRMHKGNCDIFHLNRSMSTPGRSTILNNYTMSVGWISDGNCCEATRLRSRLISVVYVQAWVSFANTSSFQIFGCMYACMYVDHRICLNSK